MIIYFIPLAIIILAVLVIIFLVGRHLSDLAALNVESIPEEKVATEVASLKEIFSKKGAEFIAEEAPELRTLAYTMAKKIRRFSKPFFPNK